MDAAMFSAVLAGAFGISQFLYGIANELLLFAAVGIFLFGIDDAMVDALWIFGFGRKTPISYRHDPCADVHGLHYAVMIPAWQESDVIEATVTRILALWGRNSVNYHIYIGCYANDPLTVFAASRVASMDDRVRIVIHPEPGHSTKADCLNMIWTEIVAYETQGGPEYAGIVLQDAEDIVHAQALHVMVAQSRLFDLVQLPVRPIIEHETQLVSAHYADEFAEMHGKDLLVRQALGAVVPAAGVGFLLTRPMIDRLSSMNSNIFSRNSLTEDYELSFRVAQKGGTIGFCVLTDSHDKIIATECAYPNSLWQSVRQKSRWVNGIALSGWDRLGWPGYAILGNTRSLRTILKHIAGSWMVWRDRRVVLNAVVIVAAYTAIPLAACAFLLSWVAIQSGHDQGQMQNIPHIGPALGLLLLCNAGLLIWRLGMRTVMTMRIYGWRSGLWAIPRSVISNLIVILSVRRAFVQYWRAHVGQMPLWEKTDHARKSLLGDMMQNDRAQFATRSGIK